jgi:hypothetical protein
MTVIAARVINGFRAEMKNADQSTANVVDVAGKMSIAGAGRVVSVLVAVDLQHRWSQEDKYFPFLISKGYCQSWLDF